jgi:DUF4097 and DUF4098 domain-containing protein YvlB
MKKDFDTPGSLKLVTRIPAGRAEIQTVDGTRTEIEVRPLGDDEASRAAAEETRVEARERGSTTVVEVEVPESSKFFSFKQAKVLIVALVPHGTDVEADAASADVEGRGRFGSAQVKTASGDVTLENLDGALEAKSASGDLSVGTVAGTAKVSTASGDIAIDDIAGAGKIQTASGDVEVHQARSSLKVLTASGDQTIGSVSEGQVNLQSASGDVEVGVRRGSILWIDAKSLSGDTTSDLEVEDAPPEGPGPQLEVRANTMSGDIHVVRADAVPA